MVSRSRPTANKSPSVARLSVSEYQPARFSDLHEAPYSHSTDTGANASTEEAEEGVDDTTEKVIDVVHSFRLQEVPLDKKGYLAVFKSAFNKVLQRHEEKADAR